MTPLVKYLLKKRSKLTNRENIQILNKKIGELISKNRRSRKGLVHVGSCVWWNKVDKLSNRRYFPRPVLDVETLNRLNDYFGNLCSDPNYKAP